MGYVLQCSIKAIRDAAETHRHGFSLIKFFKSGRDPGCGDDSVSEVHKQGVLGIYSQTRSKRLGVAASSYKDHT